ncbi:MAG: hypothetical protein HY906_15975, partial [Deltaproteobacteria bacterium]|nr:hypothetical protein [Deltaproteobacteria bacterium]
MSFGSRTLAFVATFVLVVGGRVGQAAAAPPAAPPAAPAPTAEGRLEA